MDACLSSQSLTGLEVIQKSTTRSCFSSTKHTWYLDFIAGNTENPYQDQ